MSEEHVPDSGADPRPHVPVIYCFWCGRQPENQAGGAPLTWSLISTDQRGPQLLCAHCTRTNLRSIESQLSTDWW